ncbi:MAG: NADH-quinone oxidoreductase subunit NuoE [Candidatus Magnetoovum sp. WYHC-5]|nr:NADH-quinone oxidoreductase subunit NuoE [Candidatus Magnetoovum sp. WYHC-5]
MELSDVLIDELMGEISGILSAYEKKKGVVITTLHKIQEEEGYLPEAALAGLAKTVGLSLAEIYSVASFYKQFHFKPRGKKIVRVCTGTACHVRGASKVVDALEGNFHIKAGETTEDRKMTLETVGCVGCCGLAPVVTVNDEVTGAIGPKKIKALIKEIDAVEGVATDGSNGKGDGGHGKA